MLRRLLQGISRALPSQCAVCAAWPAAPVCDACLARFAPPQKRCDRCALLLPSSLAGSTCGRCLRSPPALDACHAAVDYGYPWAGCIAAFKFEAQPGWAGTLAALMRQAAGTRATLAAADIVVPMPLPTARLLERGYNQSLVLARKLAPGRVDAGLLHRVRDTPAQLSLDRARRLANVRGAFAADPLRRARLAGRHVAIVDDVMTSGASMEEAARQLRAAGAARVSGFVVARTPEG